MCLFTEPHTFHDLGYLRLPSELDSLLEFNGCPCKRDVAREKIIGFHFLYGESNMQEPVEMRLEVLHHLSWMGKM